MAYLSSEYMGLYSQMLSANEEASPKPGGIFNPPPKVPNPALPTAFTKRGFGKPVGTAATKGISVSGAAAYTGGTAKGDVEQAPIEYTGVPPGGVQPGGFPTEQEIIDANNKRKIMPLVYIGGAGLLLYYLFKK